MMETNLSNGMNDRSYSRFFGFVIVMSAVLFSFSSCLGCLCLLVEGVW